MRTSTARTSQDDRDIQCWRLRAPDRGLPCGVLWGQVYDIADGLGAGAAVGRGRSLGRPPHGDRGPGRMGARNAGALARVGSASLTGSDGVRYRDFRDATCLLVPSELRTWMARGPRTAAWVSPITSAGSRYDGARPPPTWLSSMRHGARFCRPCSPTTSWIRNLASAELVAGQIQLPDERDRLVTDKADRGAGRERRLAPFLGSHERPRRVLHVALFPGVDCYGVAIGVGRAQEAQQGEGRG